MKLVMSLLLAVLLINSAYALGTDSITLLALMENGTGQSGGVAKLQLELAPGKERVFLETFPMTKISTQASLRFAQQVACKELDIDCSGFDFLFTVKAMPGIIGGPSAGSAATFVASALLLNKSVPKEIAMTGTINSGGIIGPVGGTKQKIEAAASNGIKRVYIPKWTKDFKEGNKTTDLIEYGKKLNISVREAATISDILEIELGVPKNKANASLKIDERYAKVMREVASDLCKRTGELENSVTNDTQAKEYAQRAKEAMEKSEYYSAASYCFRANVERKQGAAKNLTRQLSEKRLLEAFDKANQVKKAVESRKISTLTDLQTMMAVMERVTESIDALNEVNQSLAKNKTGLGPAIAYAEERLFSGMTWQRFFDGSDSNFEINEETLKAGCAAKISESEERYNYVKSILPEALEGTRLDIDKAYGLLNDNEYSMCLYTASKAKAETDVILSVMGIEDKNFAEVIALKLDVAKDALMKAQSKNIFPIIAYSYYEYSNSLRNFDNASSLLFSEYSLELANLDMYFFEAAKPTEQVLDGGIRTAKEKARVYWERAPRDHKMFLLGAVMGIVLLTAIRIFFALINRLFSRREFQTLQAPPKRRLRGKKR